MKLIFLDFDGVLHPGLAGTFCYLSRFETFLRDHPEVRVVLSTSWRCSEPFADLRNLFYPDIQPRILGVTPDLPHRNRYGEILQWLADHQATGVPWAALDDDRHLFPPACHNLVLCDTARGLRAGHLLELKDKLGLA